MQTHDEFEDEKAFVIMSIFNFDVNCALRTCVLNYWPAAIRLWRLFQYTVHVSHPICTYHSCFSILCMSVILYVHIMALALFANFGQEYKCFHNAAFYAQLHCWRYPFTS